MTALLSYGEVLVDFIPNDDLTQNYQPMAGGAPANVAVAFAKLGGKSYFAGGISTDDFGQFLRQSLITNGVNIDYCSKEKFANTALVLVTLDKSGERSFNFYRHNTADTLYSSTHIKNIDWKNIGIFHFCSNTLTNQAMFDTTQVAVRAALANDKLISFDVNLRQQLWSNLSVLSDRFMQCLKNCHLVKLSKEEGEYIAQHANLDFQQYLQSVLALGVKLIIVTDGDNDVQLISEHSSIFIATPVIKAIDTTGAGDSFISGFLYELSNGDNSASIANRLSDLKLITRAADFAVKCGAYTCQRKGAFSALPQNKDIQ